MPAFTLPASSGEEKDKDPAMTSLPKVFSQFKKPSSLLQLWGVLRGVPGGGLMMGRLLGRLAPYTGTIKPEIEALEVGYARVRMRDRKKVRNHLKSLHAIALMNLGEVATGVAMMVSLPDGARAILTGLSMEYLKKGRGTITAECSCPVPQSTERKAYELTGELKDKSGEVIARAHAKWLVGPAK
jgi:acyl-coenzyme A thioesterase PaaI-like protein